MSTEATIAPYCRPPLSESTNDLNAYVAVASAHTIKTTWPNTLRRKASTRALYAEADSSESLPSSHSSIFEALYCDASNENFDGKAAWLGTFVQGGSRSQPSLSTDAIKLESASTPPNPSKRSIHLPTPLETITEQKSKATLRAQQSFSTRRKISFSLDDLDLYRRSSRLFKHTSSSSSTAVHPHVPQLVYPVAPFSSPPFRVPTPPGLPTFNTSAATAYRLPYPRTTFRSLFRRNKTPEERQWIAQTTRLPQGVLMRGEDGLFVRGRWRPSQSGHTGNARRAGARAVVARPLHVAPLAGVPAIANGGTNVNACTRSTAQAASRRMEQPVLQDVGGLLSVSQELATFQRSENVQARFTSSANVNRSAAVQFQNLSLQTPNVAAENTEPQRPGGDEKLRSWGKFGDLFCYVCCGVDKPDDGNLHPRIMPNMEELGGVR